MERTGAYGEAITLLRRALDREPASAPALVQLERLYRRQGTTGDILPLIRRGLTSDPSAVFLRQMELRTLVDLGRTQELRRAGNRWLQEERGSETAYREYALALMRTGDLKGAESVLSRGRDAIGRPDALAPQLADLYVKTGRWADAASEWAALVRAEPGMGLEMVSTKLAVLGGAAGPVATALLDQLQGEAGKEAGELSAIAALYAGQLERARSMAGSLLSTLPSSERRAFADRFARAADRQSQPGTVAWTYQQVLGDVSNDSTRLALARQIVSFDLNAADTTAALAVLKEMSERDDAVGPARRWASAMRVRLQARVDPGAAQKALAAHARAFPDDPELGELTVTVAEADLRANRLNDAEKALSTPAMDRLRGELRARASALRGYLALYRGRHDEARRALEYAAASLSGEPRGDVLRILGFLRNGNTAELMAVAAAHQAMYRGNPAHAAEILVDRLNGAPTSAARPGIELWAGELALRGDALDRAEPILRSIPERFPDSGEAPVAMLTLAEAKTTAGEPAVAMQLLEDLIMKYPKSAIAPIARRRLSELQGQVPKS